MLRCCICGKEITDEVRDACNPDPLKDEDGNFLGENDVHCCQHCDNLYVTPFRICLSYREDYQCELIQKKVLELRKGWRK